MTTNLHFLVSTNSTSTALGEREEPPRERRENAYSIQSSRQRLHKGYSMPLGDFALVPVPVDIDTEA